MTTLPVAYMAAIKRAWAAGLDSHDICKSLRVSEDCVLDALAELRRSNSKQQGEGIKLKGIGA